MVNMTGSFASPSADATISPQLFAPVGVVAAMLDGLTVWKLILTLFVAAVIYDQCKSTFSRISWKNVSFARSLCKFQHFSDQSLTMSPFLL